MRRTRCKKYLKCTNSGFLKIVIVALAIVFLISLSSCTNPAKKPAKWPVIKAPTIVKRSPEDVRAEMQRKKDLEQIRAEEIRQAELERLNKMPKVTGEFFGNDVKDVLRAFTEQTNVPIVYDAILEGEIFANFNEVPLELALEQVLFSGGYEYKLENGVYYATNPDPQDNLNALRVYESETFRTNLPAQQIMQRMNMQFHRFIGHSEENPHYITINAPPRIIKQIKEIVKRIDSFQNQIVIDVLVIDISFARGYSIGIDHGDIGLVADGVIDLEEGIETAYTSTIMGNILSTIQFLWQNGAVDLKANPKIVTLDGKEATLDVSIEQRFPILSGNVSFPQIFIEVIKTGTVLTVTPNLLPDGYILMNIHPEVSDVVGETTQSSEVGGQQTLPVVSRRSITSTVKVRLGETIIIGGLRSTFLKELESKVPGLGDIPVVDFAFRNKKLTQETREMMVLLTPRLVEGGIDMNEFDPDIVSESIVGSQKSELDTAYVSYESVEADKRQAKLTELRSEEQELTAEIERLRQEKKRTETSIRIAKEQLQSTKDEAAQKLKDINAEIEKRATETSKLKSKQDSLTRDLKKLEAAVTKAQEDVRKARIEQQKAKQTQKAERSIELEEAKNREQEARNQVEGLRKELLKVKSEGEQLAQEVINLEKSKQAAEKDAATVREKLDKAKQALATEKEIAQKERTERRKAEHIKEAQIKKEKEEAAEIEKEETIVTQEPVRPKAVPITERLQPETEQKPLSPVDPVAAPKGPVSWLAESCPFEVELAGTSRLANGDINFVFDVKKRLDIGQKRGGSLELALVDDEGEDFVRYAKWKSRGFYISRGVQLSFSWSQQDIESYSKLLVLIYNGSADKMLGKYAVDLRIIEIK